jgi:glycosyltransferase involved in cell wall biosynthesis
MIVVDGKFPRLGSPLASRLRDIRVDIVKFGCPHTPLGRMLGIIRQTITVIANYRRYDLVFSTAMANILPLLCLQRLTMRSRPAIVAVDISTARIHGIWRKAVAFLVEGVTKLICHTSAQKRSWIEAGLDTAKVEFVPLGVEVGEYPEPSLSRLQNRVFSAGRVARDFQTLIAAMKDIPAELIIVAGKDPITGKTGLEGVQYPSTCQIHFNVPYDEFLSLMANSKVVVIPLHDRPYAAGQLVLLDAMALGKAVVATRTAGTLDYIEDGKTGLLVQAGNVNDLHEKIMVALQDSNLAMNLGSNARAAIESSFSLNNSLDRICAVIQATLNEYGASP